MNWIAIASLNLACAVTLGAFGAHGLKAMATAEQLAWWQTGTLYFFFHALGLLIVGVLIKHFGFSQLPAWLLQAGIVIFWQFVSNGVGCSPLVWSNYANWWFADDSWLALFGCCGV